MNLFSSHMLSVQIATKSEEITTEPSWLDR